MGSETGPAPSVTVALMDNKLAGARHRGLARFLRLWLPVLAWAGLIVAFSSVPDLSTGLGVWDVVLRKIAHAAEYAVLGALLVRALPRPGLAFALGVAYAISDEAHQSFIAGRTGSPLDVALDAVGVLVGVALWHRFLGTRARVTTRALTE